MILNHSYSIHKFGGSSLANAKQFMDIKSLLKGKNEILVVSATQGTTSALQGILDEARNSLNYMQMLDQLEENHLMLIRDLSLDKENNDIGRVIQDDVFKIKEI